MNWPNIYMLEHEANNAIKACSEKKANVKNGIKIDIKIDFDIPENDEIKFIGIKYRNGNYYENFCLKEKFTFFT